MRMKAGKRKKSYHEELGLLKWGWKPSVRQAMACLKFRKNLLCRP
jgi:hypothetical protein